MSTSERSSILSHIGVICRAVAVVRAPLVAAVLAAMALSVPDQIIELYRVQGEDARGDASGTAYSAGAVTFVLLTGAFLVFLGHGLVKANGQELCTQSRLGRCLLWVLPGLSGALLVLGFAAGLSRASCAFWFKSACTGGWSVISGDVANKVPEFAAIKSEMGRAIDALDGVAVISMVIAAILLGLGLFLGRRYGGPEMALWPSPRRRWGLFGWARACVVVTIIACYIIIYIDDPSFDSLATLGAPAVIVVFIANLAYIGGFASAWLDQYRVPAITGLLLTAFGFSLFDFNDNHEIVPSASTAGPALSVNVALETWYKARKDRDQFKDKPYPVFVVATAGGGLYAAQHTAAFLSRMQDRCATFSQHVFAISGVSGGSLGATVFNGLTRQDASNSPYRPCSSAPGGGPGPMEARARRVLDQDFLSPLVAAALFPDFVQRLMPFPAPALSRGRALEASFEKAWDQAAPGSKEDRAASNPFLLGSRDHWSADGASPALFLNATSVTDGRRFVMAPMKLEHYDPKNPDNPIYGLPRWSVLDESIFDFQQRGRDIPLKTAVRVSASFPWVTPAASLWLDSATGRRKLRLVDGGVFENSGIETAHDIIGYLRPYETKPMAADAQRPWIKLHLVMIGGYTALLARDYDRFDNSFGEVMSPLRGLMNARERRGYLAWYRYYLNYCGQVWEATACLSTHSSLDLTDFHVPLGWRLSPLTARLIAAHTGRPERTASWLNEVYDYSSENPDKAVRTREAVFGWLQENDESACNIMLLLAGRTIEELLSVRKAVSERHVQILTTGSSDIPPPSAADLCSS